MKLFLFIIFNFFIQAYEIKNKLVLDYGNFLEIEEQKSIHLALESFYKENNIYISIVTLNKEESYNLVRSIREGIKKINKKGFENIIIILRSLEGYKIYTYGFQNSLKLKEIINQVLNNGKKHQSYFEEFKDLLEMLKREQSILKKYIFKNNFQNYFFNYKYHILILSFLILIFVINILKRRKRYFERLGMK